MAHAAPASVAGALVANTLFFRPDATGASTVIGGGLCRRSGGLLRRKTRYEHGWPLGQVWTLFPREVSLWIFVGHVLPPGMLGRSPRWC